MMMKGTIFAVGCVFIIGTAAAADGVPGKCPDIELVKDFVPSKVVGLWHALYEIGEPEVCKCYELEEVSPNHFLGHFHHLNLTVPLNLVNPDNPSEGLISYSKFDPKYDKIVMRPFATDYENYAGVFSCKEVGDVHFPSYAIWSRSTKLDEKIVQEMKDILSKYEGIDVTKFEGVDHDNCEF